MGFLAFGAMLIIAGLVIIREHRAERQHKRPDVESAQRAGRVG